MIERLTGFLILVAIATWMIWIPFLLWGAFWLLGVWTEPSECPAAPIGC